VTGLLEKRLEELESFGLQLELDTMLSEFPSTQVELEHPEAHDRAGSRRWRLAVCVCHAFWTVVAQDEPIFNRTLTDLPLLSNVGSVIWIPQTHGWPERKTEGAEILRGFTGATSLPDAGAGVQSVPSLLSNDP
jgi:hypothetical protein